MSAPSQLVLRFPPSVSYGEEALLPHAGQAEALAWLARPGDWPLGRLALWGPAGSGKSHLAYDWARRMGGIVLPYAPDEGWPGQAVALDSIDAVPDEPALLHWMNAAAETGQPLLLVCDQAPGRLPVRLPDLASRLRATLAVRIGPADDAFLEMLLARLLAERQLRLPAALQGWLLTRLQRTPSALQDAVARLDAAGLAAGRTITRPLAAAVLGFDDISPQGGAGASPDAPGLG